MYICIFFCHDGNDMPKQSPIVCNVCSMKYLLIKFFVLYDNCNTEIELLLCDVLFSIVSFFQSKFVLRVVPAFFSYHVNLSHLS